VRLPGEEATYLLERTARLDGSGLRQGCWAEPVPVGRPQPQDVHVEPVAAWLQVVDGMGGVRDMPLRQGENLVGRSPSCRVVLDDELVSRHHAAIEVLGDRVRVRDLGSSNGTAVGGIPISEADLPPGAVLALGRARATVRVAPAAVGAVPSGPRGLVVPHVRSPRLEPVLVARTVELPTPSTSTDRQRPPMLALLAPLVLGLAMYAVTRSPASLVLVALSPLVALTAYVDGKISARRDRRRAAASFDEALRETAGTLAEARHDELRAREGEAPSTSTVVEAAADRGSLLWSRRADLPGFGDVRLGTGSLPSRVTVVVPGRPAHVRRDQDAAWEELASLARAHGVVGPVPVVERLADAGNIGIVPAGGLSMPGPAASAEPDGAEGLLAALVVQLVGLHSPADLVVTAIAGEDQVRRWAWLKWLPHAATSGSPVAGEHLVDDAVAAEHLLRRLEAVVRARSAASPGRQQTGPAAAARDPLVVLVVLEPSLADRARLEHLAEAGPAVGVHLLWLARSLEALPAACRTFVEVGTVSRVGRVRTGAVIELTACEQVPSGSLPEVARLLCATADAGSRAGSRPDLPNRITHADLVPGVSPDSASAVVEAWRAPSDDLGAVVGRTTDGPMRLSLRGQGPHAIVGGTTGAGKSEFLQTWVMALAAAHSPRRVTFLLVDYKGGAAFAECTRLPHTVGLVTDLTPHLVRRALTALRAELTFRERLLDDRGAKDLLALERRGDPDCPPALVIVVDELAALVADVPEFVEGLVDVAQRGRSLGLHLVLATQRPAGVVKDNLRANASLRVALRVADEPDSRDVVGVPDAARIDAGLPGRAVARWGAGPALHFQTTFLGARRASGSEPSVLVHELPFGREEHRVAAAPREGLRDAPEPERDIVRLLRAIRRAARREGFATPRRPWLDPLAPVVALDPLVTALRSEAVGSQGADEKIPLGLIDEPHLQRRSIFAFTPGRDGHLGIMGAGGSGRSGALRAVALAASARSTEPGASPLEVHAIDMTGGALSVLEALPTVGSVVAGDDEERTGRLVRRLVTVVQERRRRLRDAGAPDLAEYRRLVPAHGHLPRVLLLVDGFTELRQRDEQTLSMPVLTGLASVMAAGRQVGVHVVLTVDRPGAVPASMSSSIAEWVVLRLASPTDHAVAGVPPGMLEEAPPGRGVVRGRELQLGVWGGRPDLDGQHRAVVALATTLRAAGTREAEPVGRLATAIRLADLPACAGGRPTIGVRDEDLAPVGLPPGGLVVVAGPRGSGRSTALGTIVAALRRVGAARNAALLSLSRSADGSPGTWQQHVRGAEAVAEASRALAAAWGGALGRGGDGSSSRWTAGRATSTRDDRGSEPGTRTDVVDLVVVEAAEEVEGTVAETGVVALLKAARRSGVTVVVELDSASAGTAWQLSAELRTARTVLVLGPDEGDPESLLRITLPRGARRRLPAGRGYLVERGRPSLVQVATSAAATPRRRDGSAQPDLARHGEEGALSVAA